eukprot:8828368-Alexandrium_andersonii.AAC.1
MIQSELRAELALLGVRLERLVMPERCWVARALEALELVDRLLRFRLPHGAQRLASACSIT